jgi:class 3 adenylate cyclase
MPLPGWEAELLSQVRRAAGLPALEIGIGVNTGEIYAACVDGTRVQGTFVIGSGTASGSGNATDTNGNVYKLLF